MIKVEHTNKTFSGKYGEVHALQDVSIHVEKGDIYGIIGFSGAGKSTLLRLVNGLETPDSGTVMVHDQDLGSLKKAELRKLRRKIGMVFQQFNLLDSKTVFHNIALPLILEKAPKDVIEEKVNEVLRFVELEDKKDTYVSQLSGGQKQRVGIARALTTTPDILLCDEATSALDPQTTESILKLLKKINKEMGVTILLITHQMQVVQMICNKVAVMENGKVVESGSVLDVFGKPQALVTKRFPCLADAAAMPDKPVMGPAPPFFGDSLLKPLFYFQRGAAYSQLKPVGHAEHMGIYGDSRRIVEDTDQYIGGLTAHAGKFDQFIECTRHLSVILLTEDSTIGQDIFCLTMIESACTDFFFQTGKAQSQHFFRRIIFRKHRGSHHIDPFIRTLGR